MSATRLDYEAAAHQALRAADDLIAGDPAQLTMTRVIFQGFRAVTFAGLELARAIDAHTEGARVNANSLNKHIAHSGS